MTTDYSALVANAKSVEKLAPQTRTTTPSPFLGLVTAAYNDGEGKQVGPLNTEVPEGKDGNGKPFKSQLEDVAARVASAASGFKRDMAKRGLDVTQQTRKFIDHTGEFGDAGMGYVQVKVEKTGGATPVVTDVVITPDEPVKDEPARRGRRA